MYGYTPTPVPGPAPAPAPPRKRRRPLALILGGAALILARLIIPDRPGLMFRGSISEVASICHSGIGAWAVALHPGAQASCNDADTAMTLLNVALFAGLVLAAFGGYLAWRRHEQTGGSPNGAGNAR